MDVVGRAGPERGVGLIVDHLVPLALERTIARVRNVEATTHDRRRDLAHADPRIAQRRPDVVEQIRNLVVDEVRHLVGELEQQVDGRPAPRLDPLALQPLEPDLELVRRRSDHQQPARRRQPSEDARSLGHNRRVRTRQRFEHIARQPHDPRRVVRQRHLGDHSIDDRQAEQLLRQIAARSISRASGRRSIPRTSCRRAPRCAGGSRGCSRPAARAETPRLDAHRCERVRRSTAAPSARPSRERQP